MIKSAQQYFANVKTVTVDGMLYVIIGCCTAIIAIFGSDESYKYCNPYLVFWIKAVASIVNGGALSLKMYRSTQFANHLDEKKKETDTEFFKQKFMPTDTAINQVPPVGPPK